MNNANKILSATTVVLLLLVVSFLGWQMMARSQSYYAVMMLGGDLFFGELHYLPSLRLENVWSLQNNPADEQNPVSLVKLDKSIWGPEDVLYLNQDNIIWKTKLRSDSQVLTQIKNPYQVPSNQQPPPQQPSQGAPL